MKRIITPAVTAVLLLFIGLTAHSQRNAGSLKMAIIEPYPLQITLNKTTNLVFPYAIRSVDRGSRDVLVQKAKGVENILLVKAGRESFGETNLSVITADGKLHSFLLNYSSHPVRLNLVLQKDTSFENTSESLQPENNEAQLEMTAGRIAGAKRTLSGIKNGKYSMRLRLNGLYIKNDVLYFQLEVRNRSNIGYNIDLLRFFIKDVKKAQRTASQEIELQPLYVYGDTTAVKEQSKNILVIAMPKFTIPDKKYLLIQLMEGNGGRHLRLLVYNRTLVRARATD